jgi:hypothetical protein
MAAVDVTTVKKYLGVYACDFDPQKLLQDMLMVPIIIKQSGCSAKRIEEVVLAFQKAPSSSLVFVPHFTKLLRLLLTFPYSTATAERSFSTLRRLKTRLRSTMSQERISDMAVCNIHRARLQELNVTSLCKEFSCKTDKRIHAFETFNTHS